MKLLTKCAIALAGLGIVAVGYYWLYPNNSYDLQSSLDRPLPETPSFAKLVEEALKMPDMVGFAGTYRHGLSTAGILVEYKFSFSQDGHFLMTVGQYADNQKWENGAPDAFGKLSGTYQIKGHVVQFANLDGNKGLMSQQARSVVRVWSPAAIDFLGEDGQNGQMQFVKVDERQKKQ